MDSIETDAQSVARAKRVAQQAARLHSALVHVQALQQVPSAHPLTRTATLISGDPTAAAVEHSDLPALESPEGRGLLHQADACFETFFVGKTMMQPRCKPNSKPDAVQVCRQRLRPGPAQQTEEMPPQPPAPRAESTGAPPGPSPTAAPRQPFADLAAPHGKAPQRRQGYWWELGPVVLSGGEEEVRVLDPLPGP